MPVWPRRPLVCWAASGRMLPGQYTGNAPVIQLSPGETASGVLSPVLDTVLEPLEQKNNHISKNSLDINIKEEALVKSKCELDIWSESGHSYCWTDIHEKRWLHKTK